ncbi:MAG: hypothetical protein GY696_04105 [Gammaproteobacteria bacterium]|nr:hypothetical protein [Gammaproteobacteria bacterium]
MLPQEKGKSPAELFWRREIRPDAVPNRSQPWRRIRLDRRNPAETVDQEIRPFLGPSKYHRGDRVLTKLPWAPKGCAPWSEPKTVERVLGTYNFLLSDRQVWNSRMMKPWRRTEQNPPANMDDLSGEMPEGGAQENIA